MTLPKRSSELLGRPVINETGIVGRFDLRVEFSRQGTLLGPLRPDDVEGGAPASDPVNSIFSALPEQLGFRLEPAKGEVEAFVIDHIREAAGELIGSSVRPFTPHRPDKISRQLGQRPETAVLTAAGRTRPLP